MNTTEHHHIQTTTGLLAAKGERTEISNCIVSNRDVAIGRIDDEAAIVLAGPGDLFIRDTVAFDSQRGLLTYDHPRSHWLNGNRVPKTNVDVRGFHVDGFNNINEHPNKAEMILIHGRPRHIFPDSAGYGTVRLQSFSGANNNRWTSIWKAEIDELLIHDCFVNAIDIGVQKPIRKMHVSDVSANRIIVRMLDGFEIEHVGDWHLDDRYTYELYDQRRGERFGDDTYAADFDAPQDIRDWWHDRRKEQD